MLTASGSRAGLASIGRRIVTLVETPLLRRLTPHLRRCHVSRTPTEDRLPAWRRACLAYDEWRQAGANDHEAREAAVAAVQTVLPLPWQEASIEAANAVAYVTRYHPEWFWRGAQHTEKRRANVRDNLDRRDPRH